LEQVVFESTGRLIIKANDGVLRVRSPQSLGLLDELPIDRAFVVSSCGTVLQSYRGELRRIDEPAWTPAPGGFSPVFFDSPAGIVGLSETGSLAVDGEPVPLCSACTSLHLLAPDFLVVGGVEKSLRFLPLSQPPSTWCQESAGEEASRRIEAGAEIVCASSAACSLVLQAPRGNLETIYPRAMVLAGIRKALGRFDYRRAYLDCRRHRIDLNFLHDAQPAAFMATVDRFVAQVKEPDYLNLFLSSLSPEDCTRTKYPGFTPAEHDTEADENGDGKVNRICEAIRNAIDQNLVEPVMTSYVCQRPPQLEAALRALLRLTESDAGPEAMERALAYLVWLVDPSKLYDVALGLYHLPLSLSIGRRSQKDPAEYVGFLEEMAALPEALQRFRIDDRLGRDGLALTSLWRCVQEGSMGETDLLGYIEAKPQLYKPALSLPEMPEDLLRRILTQFAGHCQATGALDAAAALFRRAKDYAPAFEVCVEAGLWQEALAIANEIGMEEGERMGLLGDLFERLMRSSRYAEAYALTLGCDVDLALEAALAGHLWLEASRLPVSASDCVLPKATEVAEGLLNDLTEIQKTFGEQSTRLLFLIRRLIDPPKSQTTNGSVAEISDTLSEMSFHSTASTRLTRSSTASSSRSKKKTERAKLRTKPGSPYERDGLRVALEQLLAKANQIQSGIRPLLVLLAACTDSTALASKLQEKLSQVIGQMAAFSAAFRDLHSRLVAKMLAQANGAVSIGGPEMTNESYCEEIANRHAWQAAFQLPPGFEVTAHWSLPFL
jgi:elongator complex protein 1